MKRTTTRPKGQGTAVLGPEGSNGVRIELSPVLLVRLVRDLLVCREHRAVRVTDGPGDGGRDVHSLAPDGKPHLAQCKHHDDASAVCGSSEVSELPMALVKFDVAQGLFVTDARISPQAKREYIQDYPKLALEFLDRDELVAEVVSNPVLRALWFDGGKLGTVNGRITFPVIIRRHDGDRPLLPLRHSALRERIYNLVGQEAALRKLKVEARESRSSRAPFEPYRPPRRLTMDEGFTTDLRVTEIGFRGGVALHDVSALAEALAIKLAEAAAAEFDATTVVVGSAFVTPLEGDHAGMRTMMEASRVAAIGVGTSAVLESEWFQPGRAGEWDAICDARVSESEWVRVYHPPLDVAASCEIATPPAPHDVLMRQTSRLGWEKSVFALLPEQDAWDGSPEVPAPDDRILWRYEAGKMLCGWFHPLSRGGLVMIPTDPGDEEPLPGFDVDDEAADREMDLLRELISKLDGVELVTPDRARHMLALVSADPLPRDDAPTLFRTADVLASFGALASPIDPSARRGSVTIAWRASGSKAAPVDTTGQALAVALEGGARIVQEDGFAILTIEVPALPRRMSTPAWLDLVAAQVKASGAGARCGHATAQYWAHRYGVRFGVHWHEGDKVVAWEQTSKGFKPIKLTRKDIEDPDRPWPPSADEEGEEGD
ncbi:MAG: restriction endonuclease [Labilithrix sp.]|nr:restriction endonuclease [Labilithrix sp.]